MIGLDPSPSLGYALSTVLKTLESGHPLRHRGFFMPARIAPSMGRVRHPVRLAARLSTSFHTLPALLKTGLSLIERSTS
jgi:hypothetical protein